MGNYRDALRGFNEEFKKAEAFGNDWTPPDGTYTVTLTDVKGDTYEKDGQTVPYVKPMLTIVDGEFTGKQTALGFFTPATFGSLKGITRSLNNGIEPASVDEALTILDNVAKESTVFTVKAETRKSKKNGRDYTSLSVVQVLGGADASVVEATPSA